MITLNTMSYKMALHLAKTTDLDKNKIDALRFGLEILLGILTKGLVLFSLAYLLGIIPQVAIALTTASLFRMLSGGAHCTSYGRCLIFGVAIYLLLSKLSLTIAYLLNPMFLMSLNIFILIITIICTIKYAPAEVPQRP